MLDSLKKANPIEIGQIYLVDDNYILIARIDANNVCPIYIGDGNTGCNDIGNRWRKSFDVHDSNNIDIPESEEILGCNMEHAKLIKTPLKIYGVQ